MLFEFMRKYWPSRVRDATSFQPFDILDTNRQVLVFDMYVMSFLEGQYFFNTFQLMRQYVYSRKSVFLFKNLQNPSRGGYSWLGLGYIVLTRVDRDAEVLFCSYCDPLSHLRCIINHAGAHHFPDTIRKTKRKCDIFLALFSFQLISYYTGHPISKLKLWLGTFLVILNSFRS